jgi:hypothetical protein
MSSGLPLRQHILYHSTNLDELVDDIAAQEVLITASRKPQLRALLTRRLYHVSSSQMERVFIDAF